MLVLGIESSCDETSVAVVRDGCEILSNRIYSQIAEHAPFHGVVPEIASRAHLEKINFVLHDALREAGVRLSQIEAIAVTNRPGLVGSLMIGAQLARSIRLVYNIPLIPVNHLEAHLYAACLEGWQPVYPFLGLLLSGGNSAIYVVEAPGKMSILADTMDDACGEAFDKAASVMGLPYPGGPYIEKHAHQYASTRQLDFVYKETESLFPRLLRNRPGTQMAFSFSGIKTAVMHQVRKACKTDNTDLRAENAVAGLSENDLNRIAYDFQNTVFELVLRNLSRAVRRTGLQQIVAAGGVLANGVLRMVLEHAAARSNWDLVFAQSRVLCTDNAGMVAALGYYLLQEGFSDAGFDFEVSSKSGLPQSELMDAQT